MPLLRCLNCQAEFSANSRIYTCQSCAGLLDVVYEVNEFSGERLMSVWDWRRASPKAADQSGVWRFRELLPDADESEIITLTEGNTQLWDAPRSASYAGMPTRSYAR